MKVHVWVDKGVILKMLQREIDEQLAEIELRRKENEELKSKPLFDPRTEFVISSNMSLIESTEANVKYAKQRMELVSDADSDSVSVEIEL